MLTKARPGRQKEIHARRVSFTTDGKIQRRRRGAIGNRAVEKHADQRTLRAAITADSTKGRNAAATWNAVAVRVVYRAAKAVEEADAAGSGGLVGVLRINATN